MVFSRFLSVFLRFLKFISFFERIFCKRENQRNHEKTRAFTEFVFLTVFVVFACKRLTKRRCDLRSVVTEEYRR